MLGKTFDLCILSWQSWLIDSSLQTDPNPLAVLAEARHGTTWHDDKNKQQLRNDMQSRQSYTELHFLTTQKFERHKDATDQTEEI